MLLALAASLLPSTARASGFAVAHFASEHGHPTTSNATAVYFNPAALTLSDGLHLFAELSLAVRRVSYDRTRASSDAPEPPDAAGVNVGRAVLVNPLVNPVLAESLKLGNVSLGAGFFTPFRHGQLEHAVRVCRLAISRRDRRRDTLSSPSKGRS